LRSCSDKELLLHGLLDGELDAANTMSLEAHLSECSGCGAEFKRLQALRSRLRTPGVAFEASATLRARVVAAVDAERRGTADGRAATPLSSPSQITPAHGRQRFGSRWQRTRLFPWVWAGSVTGLAAALALVLFLQVPRLNIEDQLVAGHVHSLLASHLVDVATSDRHVVKPWFAGKVDFSPPVLELADQGFPLVGGRLDYIQGRVVAAVVYRRRQHIINVFVWPADGRVTVPGASRHEGYNVAGWKQGGLELWAVSDVDPADLQQLRAAFTAQAPR